MPVSRRTTEAMSAEVAATYARAEQRLLRLVARHLSAGHEAPEWAERKLAELQTFRKRATRVVREAQSEAAGQLTQATEAAYRRGTAAAEGELAELDRDTEAAPRQAEYAVAALVAAQQEALEGMEQQVVRQTVDAYQQAVSRAVGGTLTGATTRLEDAQQVLDDLARRGITGFTDKGGRRWELASYVEMATRTATARASVQGHLERLEDAGLPLVIVSDSPRECELCRPWEGKVLARGAVPALMPNVQTGELERVDVDATVAEAMDAGLMHPNCTHNLSAYVPGATRAGEADSNAEGYAERQELRRLERKVREWKKRQAVAMTPEAKRKADAKVRAWQGAIRKHVDDTGLIRQRQRERLSVGNPGSSTGTVDLDLGTPTGGQDGTVVDLDVAVPAAELAPADMTSEQLESELADLMAAGVFTGRVDELGAELDRRDQQQQAAVPEAPDPVAEQEALNKLLYGDTKPRDLTQRQEVSSRDRDKRLRDEYLTWAYTQAMRAEQETRGVLLSREGERAGFDSGRFFDGSASPAQVRKYASEELLRWFGESPSNGRMSFDEFRAGEVDDKKSRQATARRRERTLSEFG